MGRFPQNKAAKGSQKWIQYLVNKRPEILADNLHEPKIEWVSPLQSDNYSEYRDHHFLEILGVTPRLELSSFWPRLGPQWDALGKRTDGGVILVEAKAHLSEIYGTPCKAKSEKSLNLIRSSLKLTASVNGCSLTNAWFGTLYQYVNRLAHAYYLHVLNDIETRMVFVYFLNDSEMKGPTNQSEWKVEIAKSHENLGLNHPLPGYISEIFIDIKTVF